MADIGRNTPCPCGSGKKYKQCHLGADAAPRRHPAGPLSERLTMELHRSLSRAEIEDAAEIYAATLGDLPKAELQAETGLFMPWIIYVYPQENGASVAENHLRRARARLAPLEVELLEAEARTPLSLWEILEIKRGDGFVARDLITHRQSFVRDVSASQSVSPRSVILARVVEVAGEGMLSGAHPALVSPRDADQVLKGVLKFIRRRKLPVAEEELVDPGVGIVMLNLWRLAALPKPPPALQNTDGDPLELTTESFRFNPADRAAIIDLLAAGPMTQVEDPEDEGDETAIVFQVAGNAKIKEWDNTIIGRALVGRDRLKLETNSRRRAASLRQRVEKACGTRLRFEKTEVKNLDDLGAGQPRHPTPRAVPPPELVAAMRSMKEAHYRGWPDEVLPALGGQTPRQAARTATGRQKLDVLLREMEFAEARLPPHERFDMTSLRRELLGAK